MPFNAHNQIRKTHSLSLIANRLGLLTLTKSLLNLILMTKGAIAEVITQLKQFAADPSLLTQLRLVFGNQWKADAGQALINQLASGHLTSAPEIRLKILSQTQLHVQGAFAAQTNTIYLFEDFLHQNIGNPQPIVAVLLEEIGHYIDAQLNQSDSPGDEGAIFAAIVQGRQISPQEWQALKTENDFAMLIDQGQIIAIEQAAVIIGTAGNDSLVGTNGDDRIEGLEGDDILDGADGNDILDGSQGNDTLKGGNGNDTLFGSDGTNTLIGGAGNDVYFVYTAGDIVVEDVNGGYDEITSYIDLTLPVNVETLYLVSIAIRGTGNTGDNNITGNSQDNYLYGLTGNDELYGEEGADNLDGGTGTDTLIGGAGNDSYKVDSADDVVVEEANGGYDYVYVYAYVDFSIANMSNVEVLYQWGGVRGIGNAMNNFIAGNGLNNILEGRDGNDNLSGYAGVDTLIGGAGNDFYDADATDLIVEAANEGIDTIRIAADFSLANLANIENLWITDSAIRAIGNALDNDLTGNNQNNILEGGVGNDTLRGGYGIDTLIGGAGNDTYSAEATDLIVEEANGGIDVVSTGSDFRSLICLMWKICLWLRRRTESRATGNALNNIVQGHIGNDFLVGGSGNDLLNGGLERIPWKGVRASTP
ncbi:MAG: hypothetical protein HC769_37180 [Cyanobacteria bacterium CRU_2_1]|nr:hypothetical protein [Cyanobacteria bacterium CRU_2_1]